MSTAQPGQIWAECDPRRAGRTFVVERVEGKFAYCRTLTLPSGIGPVREIRSRIAIARMRPTAHTGYRHVGYAQHGKGKPAEDCIRFLQAVNKDIWD